jgi:type II secretory pathway component HofQ
VLSFAAGSAPAAAGSFTGTPIDLELQEAPLDGVLDLFSRIGRVNIVKQGDVPSARVTAFLRRMPWDEALYRILVAHRLEMVRDGAVIYVRPAT